jgi:hypothetical protein
MAKFTLRLADSPDDSIRGGGFAISSPKSKPISGPDKRSSTGAADPLGPHNLPSTPEHPAQDALEEKSRD